MQRQSHNIYRGLIVLILALALPTSVAQAQTADEHAAHHPGGGSPPMPKSTPAMPMGGMNKMPMGNNKPMNNPNDDGMPNNGMPNNGTNGGNKKPSGGAMPSGGSGNM